MLEITVSRKLDLLNEMKVPSRDINRYLSDSLFYPQQPTYILHLIVGTITFERLISILDTFAEPDFGNVQLLVEGQLDIIFIIVMQTTAQNICLERWKLLTRST
ncbi:hypothetical protein PHMEG_0006794 [Phytophthora megakarya]|uniref:Uncharacterized protein n=1 Tax=Phytophthora megakarya TaxID=4795 RepID=A0A225WN32_9STRA|nr:hypothetical protein PHMEG_0006794 [Phytophthora megakarya]